MGASGAGVPGRRLLLPSTPWAQGEPGQGWAEQGSVMKPPSPHSANGSPISQCRRVPPGLTRHRDTSELCPCVFELEVTHTSMRGKQLKKPWTHFNLTPTVCGRLSPQSDMRWEGQASI